MFKLNISLLLNTLLISTILILVGCSENESKASTEDYQEEVKQALTYVDEMDWENALSTLKEMPEDFNSSVTALKSLIETELYVSSFEDEFKQKDIAYNQIQQIDLTGVDTEIVQRIEKTGNEYKEFVDQIVGEVEPTEKKAVEEAYDLLWNKARNADDENRLRLLEEVKEKVSNYQDFKSDYQIDAHILYLYAEQSMLIDTYRANLVSYENGAAYSQSFADTHKPNVILHLKQLDPTNKGVYLPEHVLHSLKIGLENFFYINEADWQNFYDNPDTDWIGLANKEAKENDELRNSLPKIGMTEKEVVLTKWGGPRKINKTTTSTTVYEQWVYSSYRYIYLENGIVVAIQE